jgi:hypothetical protein
MEQTLQLLNPQVIIGEPDPFIKFHCKTTVKPEDGLLFQIGCSFFFKNDVNDIKFKLLEFKIKPNDTRYYRVSVNMDYHLFNFIVSNIQTAKLILDDDPHETPEEKVKKIKVAF